MNESLNNEKNIDDFSDEYAEALDTVPPEVRAFMWSNAFTIILKVIGDTYKLNDTQKDTLRRVAMETLVGITTPVSRRTKLADVGIVGETQENILTAIGEEIISRAIAQVDDYNELYDNNNEATSIPPKEAPNPIQALASIQERLSQTTIITPTKRDYSIEKPVEQNKETTQPKKLSPDPYREMPQE